MNSFLFITYIIINQLLVSNCSSKNIDHFRANVTMKLALSHDSHAECDETVYKIVVCAGEFTNQCQLLGPVSRFIQNTCATQGPLETLNFLAPSVESPIELDVTVQRVGEADLQHLRGTEFRLTDQTEVVATSFDLSLIVRFHVSYTCLPNFYGKLCNLFCDPDSPSYYCDQNGNQLCKTGYYMDNNLMKCRLDTCWEQPDFCLNGGTCMNNPNVNNDLPLCLCTTNFEGQRCEQAHDIITTINTPVDIDTDSLNHLITILPTESLNVTKLKWNHTVDTIPIDSILKDKSEHQVIQQTDEYHVNVSIGVQDKKGSNNLPSNSELKNVSRTAEDPKWRKIVIISAVALVFICLLTVTCLGLILGVLRRKNKEKPKPSAFKINDNDRNLFLPSVKRWASVDQAPKHMLWLDETNYGVYGPVNRLSTFQSPNNTNWTNPCQKDFNCPGNFDRQDGHVSQHKLFNCNPIDSNYFTRYSGLNLNMNTSNYNDNLTRYSTLPRHFMNHNRRLTWELGRPANSFQLPRAGILNDRGPVNAINQNTPPIVNCANDENSCNAYNPPTDTPYCFDTSSLFQPKLREPPDIHNSYLEENCFTTQDIDNNTNPEICGHELYNYGFLDRPMEIDLTRSTNMSNTNAIYATKADIFIPDCKYPSSVYTGQLKPTLQLASPPPPTEFADMNQEFTY